ncbi:AMIN-like domain-containing (lipo)protein [Saccharothrix texasensis]|uniref:AMIN-like domain-containing protein n=1 Tax=Saccharothrix texasensis TaxID=103734 RepID=A0A3N1GXF1_9PSEU|nr:hypothetical protein [Saccharothrix texasensis]ROP34819.1 hypothetical protein EDD40_0023 [Saccharothrix texasensis]
MRRVALAVVAALVVLSVVPATATAAACEPVDWGSGLKTVVNGSGGTVTDIRSGQHECFDRLVIDTHLAGGGYYVRYTDEVTHVGSGEPVPLRGGAKLFVMAYSPSYDENFDPTYTPADPAEVVDVTGYRTFRQVAWAGSWEGTTDLGLGVRAQLPFRVFTLPDRIVVDVAHQW